MYKLTLTADERRAIDFVGYRYAHGDDLFESLMDSEFDNDWDFDGNVEFKIPEHIAWRIQEIAEESNYLWDLFSAEFADKMNRFVEAIV